jgi:hypothetical protein
MSGFMHHKIQYAAEDCDQGQYELTHKLAHILKSLENIAYSVSSIEAGDDAEGSAILDTIKELPKVKAAVDDLENYLRVFGSVAQYAIREYLEKNSQKDGL